MTRLILAAAVAVWLVGAGAAVAQEAKTAEIPPAAAEAYNQGLELAQSGQYAEARAKFEEALRLAPDFREAHYNLGLVLRQLGEKEAAIAELQQSLEGSPEPALAQRIIGELLAELGRIPEAIAAFEKALEMDPEMTDLYYVEADLLARGAETPEDRQEVIAAYERALAKAPRHPRARKAYRALGKLYYRAGDREKALENYLKAVKLDPKDPELHYNCGILQSQLGKLRDAIASLKKAIELKDPNGKAHYALAGIYYNKLQKDEEAAAEYELAAQDPNFPKAEQAAERARIIREYLEKKKEAERQAAEEAATDE
jgi:superkiller protein 3